MKTKNKFLVFALMVLALMVGCNKDDNTIIDPDPTQHKPENSEIDLTLETMTESLNLQLEALSKFNEYLQETAEVEKAMFFTGLWLQQDESVEEVAFTNSYIVHVTFKNGLQSNLVFLPVDENGKAIFRGAPNISGNPGEKAEHKMPIKAFERKNKVVSLEKKEIKNKKVLVFNVEEEEFYRNNYSAPLAILRDKAITDLEVTVLSNEAARLENIEEFYKYGLIIINAHGLPGSFKIKSGIKKWEREDAFTKEVIDENILKITNKKPTDFKNGLLTIDLETELSGPQSTLPVDILEIKIGVTDKFIRSLKPLDDAVIYANFCHSGHEVEGPNTRNLVEAFKAIGAKTYYGWANGFGEGESVIDHSAKIAELQFLKNLVEDGKLTGESHLQDSGELITITLDNFEDFAPGVSVYTILPNQDGKIDFEYSYQQFWVNNVRPERLFYAVDLHHRIDPEYYYEGCKVTTDKNGLKSSSCRFKIIPDDIPISGGSQVTLRVVDLEDNPIEAPEGAELRIVWSTTGKHGILDEPSQTVDSIRYECQDKETENGTENVSAKIYYIIENKEELIDEVEAILNIENDPLKDIFYVDKEVIDELWAGGPGRSIANAYGFAPKTYPDKDVVSYSLRILEHLPENGCTGLGKTWYPANAETDLAQFGRYVYVCGSSQLIDPDQIATALAYYHSFTGVAQVTVILKPKE